MGLKITSSAAMYFVSLPQGPNIFLIAPGLPLMFACTFDMSSRVRPLRSIEELVQEMRKPLTRAVPRGQTANGADGE